MYFVFIGEFFRRLNNWLDYQSDNGFLFQNKEEIDQGMLDVQFLYDFNRKLIFISELKRWKDREFQNFFFYVSLLILKLFFLDDYFCYFVFIVIVIRFLINDIISDDEIEIVKFFI